jgi:putative RecB family exonuclease
VGDFDPAEAFNRHFNAALIEQVNKSQMPTDDWFWAGRRKPANDIDWWHANGPALVQRYIDWYESQPDISVWITPDGIPAIELDLTFMLGTTEVRVIIDQVLQAGTALIVNDLKSGSRQPDNLIQLAVGACAIETVYGIRPKYGKHFMHRDPDKPWSNPVDLSGYQYSIEYLSGQFAMLDQAVNEGIFVARPTKDCGRCGVNYACPAMGIRPKMVTP